MRNRIHLYGTYKSRDYLDEYQSTKDTLSTDYKSRDPLLSDYTSARTNSYSKPENTYTSDYPSASGGISTYKSSYSAAANDGGYTRSSYPPSSIDDHTKDYTSMYSSSRTGSDIPGSQYSATSSTGSHSTYTTSTVEGLNKHYPSAKLGDNRYNSVATDNTGGYKSGYGKASSLDNPVPTSNNLDYTSKYLSSSKPLSQSGFGRSPSVDNLFMSKPSHDTGKRYATAEDLPSDYKSRRSLPSYSSAAGDKKGRLSAAAAVGSDVGSGASRDYKISSALPPKPVRTRSYSDMGTSVSSLPSTHLKGKGNIYSSASNTVDVSSAQTLSDPLDEPHYNMSYSSKYTSMTSSNPTLAYGDEHNYHNSVSSSRFGDGASSAVTLNTNTEPVYSALPPKPKTGYSYTDVDLGVNPRNKSSFGDTVSLRGRSASVDLPVSELKSSYDTNEMYSKYSDSKPYISENPDSAYTLSLTGVSSRPGSLDDGYTSTALPSRYSSSSSTAYMPSSLTSVTSSATFSLANPSTSYPSSSMSVTSSTYPMKPLDMIQETSGRGYSYLSNNSSLGDISKSDSFLPEPKKRLFESGDDLDLSLSPIKATRKI
ncbi:hypothetical protein KUTeg_024153 [Tegillarca granosa]|uniref:Uncharacterized protein n=1 Tax=Tegillarca granosa TaxID=220873 RepID=A0ABQ9DX83_TEGGR|nr:hypothetical protein KUTeg_024153 [Tegillarca granosa]